MIPFSDPSAASLKAAFISSTLASRSRSAVKSTTETVGVGTRKDMPVKRPFNSGITNPTARAAPVVEGTMFKPAARASRRSFVATSSRRCELV